MTSKVFVVRHGIRADLEDLGWPQYADRPLGSPLSPNGVKQAEEVAEALRSAPVQFIFSSTFLRCVQTADVMSRAIRRPVYIEDGSCEELSPQCAQTRDQTLDTGRPRGFPRFLEVPDNSSICHRGCELAIYCPPRVS